MLAHVAELIVGRAERGASILDLACGTGALALRLSDLGFHVRACDYGSENFQANLSFTQADLIGEFSVLLDRTPKDLRGDMLVAVVKAP